MEAVKRFTGENGRSNVISALRDHKALHLAPEAIALIADVAEIVALKEGDTLCGQNDGSCEVYFVLYGRAIQILIDNRPIAVRGPGQILGELAAIDSTVARSATMRATGEAVVARVSQVELEKIWTEHPGVMHGIARVVGDRLRERNRFIRPREVKPYVFIGSTVEQLAVAKAIQAEFDHEVVPAVWTQGQFQGSHTTIEDLEAALDRFDFAVFVVSADDIALIRGEQALVARDNILYEMGLFMGRLGRKRIFLVEDRNAKAKRPTDLLGVTFLDFERRDNLQAAVGRACTQMLNQIKVSGPR